MAGGGDKYFHWADYVIFAATIVISLGIGLYYALSGGKQRTTSEYLVGNRQMKVIPVAISLMVSFESSITLLGAPAEVFVYGFQFIIAQFGWMTANILAAHLAVPLLHPLKLTSVYEYLEMRFKSHAVRILGTILGTLHYACYMGIVLYGPAIALEAVTGFPLMGSILSVAAASVLYTSIGGIKAVIWTDVFQCVVMFAGYFAVLIKSTIVIGGVGKTWQVAADNGRINIFNFDPDPTIRHTFWSLYVGWVIRGFGLVFNQSSVQRICSTPTLSDARKMYMITIPAFFITSALALVEGVVAYAYYDSVGCDPIASKQITNPNQIIPFMVMDIFQGLHGLPGLFLASICSASLSTLSSGLSSLSALLWQDLIKPHIAPISEFKATVIAKVSVFFFGAVAIVIALLIDKIGGTLVQITGVVLAAFVGPLIGLFIFGAFCPWGTSKGALVGGFVSTVFSCWLCLGQVLDKNTVKKAKLPPGPTYACDIQSNLSFSDESYIMTDWSTLASTTIDVQDEENSEITGISRMYTLSYLWFVTVTIMCLLLFGSVTSFLTGANKPGDVDPRLLVPFYDRLFCCLPESLLKILRCGVDYSKVDKDDFSETSPYRKNIFKQQIIVKPDGTGSSDKDYDVQLEMKLLEDSSIPDINNKEEGGHFKTKLLDQSAPEVKIDQSFLSGEDDSQNGGANIHVVKD